MGWIKVRSKWIEKLQDSPYNGDMYCEACLNRYIKLMYMVTINIDTLGAEVMGKANGSK